MKKYLLILILAILGCVPEHTRPVVLTPDQPQAILHPKIGQNFMIVPLGAEVGGVITKQSGTYNSDSFMISVGVHIKSLQETITILIKEIDKQDIYIQSLEESLETLINEREEQDQRLISLE